MSLGRVAVELDLMDPAVASRRPWLQGGQLRGDESEHGRRGGALDFTQYWEGEPPAELEIMERPASRSSASKAKKPVRKPKANTVFVVHGRDEALRKSMFDFLRVLGLALADDFDSKGRL